MSHTPARILFVFGNVFYTLLTYLLLSPCCLVGCSEGPGTQDVTVLLREHHDELRIPLTVESVEISATERIGDPPETRVTFSGTSRADEDIYIPVSLEEAFQSLGYNPADFQSAAAEIAELREPEKSVVAKLTPTARPTALIYRRIHSANDPVDFTGTGTTVKEDGRWKLRKFSVKLPDAWKKNVARSSTLPKGVIRIEQPEIPNDVTGLIDQQKQFLVAFKQARREMELRLANEQAQLNKATQAGHSWITTITGASGRPERIRAAFVGESSDGQSLILLLANADDPTQRSVWTGSIRLIPVKADGDPITNTARSRHDGWIFAMKPVEPDSVYPLTGLSSDLIIAPSAAGLITWLDRSTKQNLTEDTEALPLPDVSLMARNVQRLTTPGTVLEGQFRLPQQKSERMRMTVTENRNNGEYVRAVLESLDDPTLAVTFEGRADTRLESLYGQPFRLSRQLNNGCSTRQPLFTIYSGLTGVITDLPFVVTGNDKVTLHASGLELQPATPISDFESNKTQWEAALQPGTRWSGKLMFGDAPQRNITLTVAESRDELSSIRVLVEDNDVRTRCRVLEGTLNRSDALVDSYALSLSGSRPATQPIARASAWGGELFGVHPDQILFRLSPDGNAIIGRTERGEHIQLTRDEQSSSVPLEKAPAAKYWREKIVNGAKWRGSLYNSKVDQKTDVELEIRSDVDEMGNLSASMRIPKGPKGRIDFKGVLRLEDPQNSNAFALDLEKMTPGVDSPSPVFGRSTNIHVLFRFSTSDETLIGYAGTGASPYEEVLELVRVVPNSAAVNDPENNKKRNDE